MTSFYLVLPSNSSSSNNLSSFQVHLPKQVELENAWEVALVEMQFTLSWFNISEQDNEIVIIDKNDIKKFYIPVGRYESVHKLLVMIDEIIEETGQTLFMHDGRVNILKSSVPLLVSPKLMYMLGFDNVNLQIGAINRISKDKKVYAVAAHPPDMSAGLTSLYVYCDIVAPQITGNVESQLLRVVGVDGTFGQFISKEYASPHYLPLLQRSFNRIEVNIRDDSGNFIPFEFGKVILKLHFRPKTT